MLIRVAASHQELAGQLEVHVLEEIEIERYSRVICEIGMS